MLKLTNVIVAALASREATALAGTDGRAARLEVFPDSTSTSTPAAMRSRWSSRSPSPDGVTRDVTAKSTFALGDPKLAKVDGHIVRPQADGSGTINVTYNGKTVSIPRRPSRTPRPTARSASSST